MLLAVLLAAVVLAMEPPNRSAEVQTYEIPPGTADKVAQGLPISEVLPQRLSTVVGEELKVVNGDTTSHVFGPFVLAPGQSWSQRFAMSGDYEMTCSLYPTVDLTIGVAPPPSPAKLASAIAAAWAVVYVLLAIVLSGVLGVSIVTIPVPLADGDADPIATRSWRFVGRLSAPLPGTAFGLVLLQVVALSRVAPWRNAIASRALLSWMVLAALAAASSAFVSLADGHPRIAGQLRILALLSAGLTLGLAVWPWLGPLALSVGLMGVGVGLLGGATWLTVDGNLTGGRPEDRAPGLSVSGLVLVLAGLPMPDSNPATLAVRGVVALVAGVAALWWSSRSRDDSTWGTMWLLRAAAVAAGVTGASLILWAWITLIDFT